MTGIRGLEQRLAKLEKEDPEVAKAAEGYRKMVGRLTGAGSYGLSPSELARLYDVSQPLDRYMEIEVKPEREILSPDPEAASPQDVSPGQS
jgi:hypothetical protein